MLRAVEQFECLCHVRYVDPQAQIGSALPERLPPCAAGSQSGASKPVHGLTEADVLLAAQALRGGCYVPIEPDRSAHGESLASLMTFRAHQRCITLGRLAGGGH
jgi:hypothetical protein